MFYKLTTAVLLIASCVFAGEVVVGAPSVEDNCIPFGCAVSFGIPRYQQAYASSVFAGPMVINEITFYNTLSGGHLLGEGSWSIYLTTTPKSLNALGTFEENLGADRALFATLVGGTSIPNEWTISGTPFYYDPTGGNLLLDLVVNSTSDGWAFLNASYSSDYVRKYTDIGSESFTYGLVTGFTYEMAAVPEPGTLVGLALLGVGIVAGLQRRRKA